MSVPCKVQACISCLKTFLTLRSGRRQCPWAGPGSPISGQSACSHRHWKLRCDPYLRNQTRNMMAGNPRGHAVTQVNASETRFYVTTCETRPFTSISPVELAGHPVNRQACWALQTGVHHNLDKRAQQRSEVSHFIMRAVLSYLDLWAFRNASSVLKNKDW